MLKNIDALLNADVLWTLRAMGHGDRLVIADTNFPSDSVARCTALGELLRIDAPAARVAEAVLSVMPLDTFIDDPASRMEVVDDPEQLPAVQEEVAAVVKQHGASKLVGIERFRFYDLAKQSYCVIASGERRFYGCFMFTKGVVAPDE